MALIRTKDLAPATGAVAVYNCIVAMLAAGWTLAQFSDGTTYSATGAGLVGGGSGAGGLGNANAWAELRQPGSSGSNIRAFCIQRGADNQHWKMKYTWTGTGFVNGSPSATQMGAATNTYTGLGGGTDAAPTFGSGFAGADGTYRQQVMCDNQAPYAFLSVAWPTGSVTVDNANHAWWLDPLVGVESGSADPYEFSWDGSVGDNGFQMLPGHNQLLSSLNNAGGIGYAPLFPLPNSSGSPLTLFAGVNNDAKDSLFPVIYVNQGNYLKGVSTLFYWNTQSRKTPSMLTMNSAADLLQFGGTCVKWDGIPVVDTNGTFAAEPTAFGSPFGFVKPSAPVQPDLDVANFLAGSGLGLTLGTNLFVGSIRPASSSGPSMPPQAVFVISTPGPAPLTFKGAGQGSLSMGMIQVRLRSQPNDFLTAQTLSRQIRDTLHRATIAGYVYVVARQSEPQYLGQDQQGNEEFSLNFDLWRAATP
jgi:hypothetical protein